MTNDSFTYNGVDMFQQFKVKVIAYDLLIPERRQRRVTVPGRSGSYDFDTNTTQTHEDRILRMECMVHGELSDAQFDSLKYTLSRRGRIILWDKPDRYYIGNLYDPAEVIDSFQHAFREFEIEFLCDPYGYDLEGTVLTSAQPVILPRYKGTRQAPTRIIIRNTGTTPLTGVTITTREAN